jgi:carbonic anhydrase/acetyltransferase-like protein (isoleucine patch superfamily)
MIGAGSLLPPGKHVKSGELWVGNPAKKVRDLSEKQKQGLEYSANHYVKLMKKYNNEK